MYQAVPSHNAVLQHELDVRWTWDAGSRINGGLAVVGENVFAVDFAHELVSLDLRTGEIRWKVSGVNVLMSTPIVENGLIVVGSGHNGRLSGMSQDSPYSYAPDGKTSRVWGRPEGDEVAAFDASTGTKKWEFETIGEDMPSPGLAGGTLVFTNGDLHAYALDAASGDLVWQQNIDGAGTMASTTIAERKAFVSYCNDGPYRCWTDAIEPRSGVVVWHSPFGNSDSSPTIASRYVYVSGVNVDESNGMRGSGYVAALAMGTGRLQWLYRDRDSGPFTQVGSSERAIAGTYSEETYYQAFPTSNKFVALDAKTGRLKWVVHSAAPIKMSCVEYHGRVYVGDTAGVLYVLRARDGAILRFRSFQHPFSTSPPVIIGRTLLVAGEQNVMAMRLSDLK